MDQAELDEQDRHDRRMAREKDQREVGEAFLRILRAYESECEPWPRPAWVEAAVAAAARLGFKPGA
jgi:hypothetical protein